MISTFKKSLLALGFVFASFVCVQGFSVSECRDQLASMAQDLLDAEVSNAKITSFLINYSRLNEFGLISACDDILVYRKELGAKVYEVEHIKEKLIKYLKSFVASSFDVSIDPHFAIILGNQNPNFTVTFGNAAGEFKTRQYQLSIWSVGFKFEIAIKIDLIMIVGSGFNYYDTNKELKLGSGIDLSIGVGPGFDLTYTTIENVGSCGILIAAIPLGVSGALSYVFSGSMTPVKD